MKEAVSIIENGRDEIIDSWEAKVRGIVPASGHTESLALRDHLPDLLEDILCILKQHENTTLINEGLFLAIARNSKNHGRHRAATSFYTIDQILQEYMIFHKILDEFLISKSALTPEVNLILNYSMETSMLYSSRAFNESMQEMRQKLIGILAHDMRNPISAALFAVDIMKTAEGERREKLRLMAHKSLKRSVDLIEGLLDSVTVGAGEGMTLNYEMVNLAETIAAVYEEAKEVYPNKIELHLSEKEISGVFDETMIRRMLENLISNAIKYGTNDKPVTLAVESSEEKIIIRVHNWGNPIREESQKRIFDFLNSTHSNGVKEVKSWGMGLTLVRAVAEAHGGKLDLISNGNEGTTFSVSLGRSVNEPGKRRTALNFR